ncbi:putative Similarity [Candidatus Competibacter denitrificans Run_A_D11]|uniref:Similarity n=1 Tax=Candidatus Competibacter denitrificans Run_A_D11 TaxID=1400863 RepID=W6M094_9GAMM|nr:putative Similarity [Candidatus Competibacter denitrificans Run_A_D11]
MEKVLKIVPLHEQTNDYKYWISRPVSERIDAIEILRNQYIKLKGIEPRIQKVFRVIR